MTSGVIYMNVGFKHLNHLAVSLFQLRKIYDGPVVVLSGGSVSQPFLQKYFANEKAFQPLELVEFEYGGGGCYYAKTHMGELSPFDKTVFMDSDTLAVGDFSAVWPEEDEVRVTQFANWTTFTKRIVQRISKWQNVLPNQVRYQMQTEVPAINTGVLGFSKTSTKFMKRWQHETEKAVGTSFKFICDEIACQLIFLEYRHVVLDERWNCSPRHSLKRHGPFTKTNDARIMHGHGKKFLKVDQRIQEAIWLPVYRDALVADAAGIRSWTNSKSRKLRGLIRPQKYLRPSQCRRLYDDIGVEYEAGCLEQD